MVTDAQFRRLMKGYSPWRPPRRGRRQSGHGREDGPQVPAGGETTQPGQGSAHLASPARCLRAGVAGDPASPELNLDCRPRPSSILAAPAPGPISGCTIAYAATAHQAVWALEGPAKEVYFAPRHEPGQLSQSDFAGHVAAGCDPPATAFEHLIHPLHADLLQLGSGEDLLLRKPGGAQQRFAAGAVEAGRRARRHQTDCLSAAVHKLEHPEDFHEPYHALLRHYGLQPRKTNPHSPPRKRRRRAAAPAFIEAVDQALMLRGHRDFDDQAADAAFLDGIVTQPMPAPAAPAEEQPLRRPYRRDGWTTTPAWMAG